MEAFWIIKEGSLSSPSLFLRFRNSVLWFSVMLCAFIDQGAGILGSMLLFAFLIPTP